MVGAEPAEFDRALVVLDVIGADVMHVGPPGAGTIAKIVNNQLFLAAGVLVQEAYVLAAALGMSPTDLHRIVSASSAGPYAKLAPLLLGRRFDDVIFRLDIAAKDVGLAIETAAAAGVDVPVTRAAGALYDAALSAGDGELVFHATLRELERRAGIELEPVRRPPRPEIDRSET
jgi:2-hydroxy-3-oxopropionate reductase